jgi:hypothetical protein
VTAETSTGDWVDLYFIWIRDFQQIIINPVITVTIGIAFALQVWIVKAARGPSALSRTTLLLPVVLFLALAVSWPFRFQVPQHLKRGRGGGCGRCGIHK